jgi:hypothetical protein
MYPLYLTIDEDYGIQNTNVTTMLYNDIQTSSEYMHECVSRYHRHLHSLKYFKSKNYKYVINAMDDGWIENINWLDLNNSVNYLNEFNADRIDLCGPQPLYQLITLNEKISLIDSNNTLQWYLTNQCSLWKIDTLINIYEILGPKSDWEVEKIGSDIARQLQCKFLTFNVPAITNQGVFQRKVGMYERGKKLLIEYCNDKNLNFEKISNEFNKFI